MTAAIESFRASLKKDLIHRASWPTRAAARTAVFDYIEVFYNRSRRHSALGMLAPSVFEAQHAAGKIAILPSRAGAHAENLKNCA